MKPSNIIITVQGPQCCGKTTLIKNIICPALDLAGITWTQEKSSPNKNKDKNFDVIIRESQGASL